MIIKKFGGSSQNSPELLKNIAGVVLLSPREEDVFVVLSAKGKTTKKLLEISQLINIHKNVDDALKKIDELKRDYLEYISKLFDKESILEDLIQYVNSTLDDILNVKNLTEGCILSKGELLSTKIFHSYLISIGKDVDMLPALEFMTKGEDDELDFLETEKKLREKLKKVDSKIVITEGFICRNFRGEIDNLGFEGSDYTATILGNILDADKVEIWTDVDGIYDEDPAQNSEAKKLDQMTFDQAEIMAKNGAKVLHPKSIHPLKEKKIPLYIKNTYNTKEKGTLIN